VLNRARGGAFLALAVNTAALLSVFLFLTYYLQDNLGLSPVMTGLAFLPSPIVTALGATQGATRLARRFGARLVIPGGMALAALGMVLLAQLDAQSSYALGVVPGLVLMSFGLGCVTGLAMGTATAGVEPADAGAAGAAVNAVQQVGGSLGAALLSTLAVGATVEAMAGRPGTPQLAAAAAVHGYTTAFWISAGLLAIGAAVSGALLHSDSREHQVTDDATAPALLH